MPQKYVNLLWKCFGFFLLFRMSQNTCEQKLEMKKFIGRLTVLRKSLSSFFRAGSSTCLDSDSPAALCPEFQLGPLRPVGLVPTETVLTWTSWERPLTYLSGLISFQRAATGRPSCALDTLYCPPCLTFWPLSLVCLLCVKKLLASLLTLRLINVKYLIPTEKENPYEDVDLKRKSLGRKSCLLENRSWPVMDKKLNSPPQVSHMTVGMSSTAVL